MKPTDPAKLRREFWAAAADTLVDRETAGAAVHLSLAAMELAAIKGNGPPYIRIGRRALYRKSDVLDWIEKNGQRVENTAQLAESK